MRRASLSLAAAGLALSSCTIGAGEGASPVSPAPPTVTSTRVVVVDPTEASPVPEAPPAAQPGDSLESLARAVTAAHGGSVGIAVAGADGVRTGGDGAAYPAWSTIKVPLAVAAYRDAPAAAQASAAAAITRSDNTAAQSIWNALPVGSADRVLAEAGIAVPVNTAVVRPEFSTFGQTMLTTGQEAALAAHLPCLDGADPVLTLMGGVSPAQAYGLGRLPGARFKGGWGPGTDGGYQVRQLGLVRRPDGSDVALALTVIPASGDYASGQAMADAVAEGLEQILPGLPAAAC